MTFSVIFSLMVFGIANAKFILTMLDHPDVRNDRIAGSNLISSFLYTFRTTMGGIDSESFNDTKYPNLYGIF